MRRIFNQRVGCLLVLVLVLVASTDLIYQWVSNPTTIAQQLATFAAPTATLPPLQRVHYTATPGATPTPLPQPCKAKQRDFEMGVTFPQWYGEGYGGGDNEWLFGLPAMRKQTGSCWVEMPVLLYQQSPDSMVITSGASTPFVSSLSYGIQLAHRDGLHVFVSALLQIGGSQSWAGALKYSSYAQQQQWFQAYFQAFKPYIQAAAQAGAEQFAVGTEEEWLQENAPDDLWNTLINNVHSIFPGALTYDMNWTSLSKPVRNWMHNPNLKMIGVSAYLPQTNTPERLNQQQIANLWQTQALPELDALSNKLGEPIYISEIGYRATADAIYHPWVSTSNAPADPAEQSEACAAALENILPDPHIIGNFFWGWSDTGAFDLVDSQAATTIRSYYQSWQVPQA